MSAMASFDVEIQRNEDYVRRFAILDDAGAALNLTGATFEWSFKMRAGDPDPVIATATIDVIDAAGGIVEVSFSGSDFAAVDGDWEEVRLAYDWIATQDSITTVLARGYLLLKPGVS